MLKKLILSVVFTLVVCSLLLGSFHEANAADETLVMYFPFDEGNGGVTEDQSNFKREGKIDGAKWVDGRLNKALYFDGKSFVGIMGHGEEVGIGKATTWALWLKTEVAGQTANLVTLHGTMILYLSGGLIQAQIWTNPGAALWNVVNSNVPAQSGEWYHVAATRTEESGKITIYVNGEEKNSAVAAGGPNFKAGRQLAIGGNDQDRYPGEALFTGTIDDFRIYNRALSKNDIKDLIAALAVHPGAKLTATWGVIKK